MRDDRFGVVVKLSSGWPDAGELRALGASCVRALVTDFDELEAALRDHPPDVRVIALLDTTHPGVGCDLADLSGWDATVRELAERFGGRIWALECLSGWAGVGIDASTVVACARSAGRILREAGAETVSLLGADGGRDWMTSLQDAARLLSSADRALVGGACFQPYGRNAHGFPGFDHTRFEHGEIDIAVQNAHDIIQLPIWATELGVTLRQAGGEAGQARYVRDAFELLGALPRSVLAAATYFCWHDAVGAPHQRGEQALGLRRDDLEDEERAGAPRAAWYAFAAAAGGTVRPLTELQPCVCSVRA
jgi:hypothetical protein